MKNQKLKGENIGIMMMLIPLGIAIGLVWGIVVIPSLSSSTYTQSDVSALMKFNASEFGCHKWSLQKDKEGLFIACWFNENNNSNCDSAGCWNVDKIFIYFPQFDGVPVVVEPERQVCPNNMSIRAVYGIDENGKRITDFSYWCSDNETRPKTVPAVTKTLSGWAVDENDLATEFCRAKTYWFDTDLSCADAQIACNYDKICEEQARNKFCRDKQNTIITKSFTRGEVVEIDKLKLVDSKTHSSGKFGIDTFTTEKQKVIRCTGDDGTTKDFGDVLK